MANDGKFFMDIKDFVADSAGAEFARTFGPKWKKATMYKLFARGELKATAQWNYKAGAADEISLTKGVEVEVESFHKGWWVGICPNTRKKGFFPANYVTLKDRPCARFDLSAKPDDGKSEMTAVIIAMQPNSCMKREWYTRKEDGLDYKDTSYPMFALCAVNPAGQT